MLPVPFRSRSRISHRLVFPQRRGRLTVPCASCGLNGLGITAVYGKVRTVVWEDGAARPFLRDPGPASARISRIIGF